MRGMSRRRELFEQTIEALSKAVDARDPYTRNHSSRVSHIAEAMCRVMRLPENEIERIKWAGLLHDIGKIGIRDNVLLKEGPLDKDERILMNQHPTIGAEIVAPATPAGQRGAADPGPPRVDQRLRLPRWPSRRSTSRSARGSSPSPMPTRR